MNRTLADLPIPTAVPRYAVDVIDTARADRLFASYEWVIARHFRKTNGTAAEQLGHSSPDITRPHYIDRAVTVPDCTDALDAFDPFPSNKRRVGPNLRVIDQD